MTKLFPSLYGQMTFTVLVGSTMLPIPNIIFDVLGVVSTTDHWVRILGLGLMRSTGSGLISDSIVLKVLQSQFYHAPQFWVAMTILIGCLILSFGAFHAMILFKKMSNGNPPMLFATASTVLFVIANILNFVMIFQ